MLGAHSQPRTLLLQFRGIPALQRVCRSKSFGPSVQGREVRFKLPNQHFIMGTREKGAFVLRLLDNTQKNSVFSHLNRMF
jgi:hypothetical protein